MKENMTEEVMLESQHTSNEAVKALQTQNKNSQEQHSEPLLLTGTFRRGSAYRRNASAAYFAADAIFVLKSKSTFFQDTGGI